MGNRILVLDDEKEIAEVIALYLKNDGYQVIQAYTGREALDQVEQEPPDLALLDVMLPDEDGFSGAAEDPAGNISFRSSCLPPRRNTRIRLPG